MRTALHVRASALALAFALMPCVLGQTRSDGASPPGASGGPLDPARAAYDVRHYDLALTVDPETKTLDGTLTMRAAIVADRDEIRLDLDGRLTVSSVTVDDAEAPFTHADGRLMIRPADGFAAGNETTVAVAYGGAPRVAPRPPWDGGLTWSKTRDGEPWIATSCQGEGADLWWPCKDHPSDEPETMDLRITVPAGLVCASNGTLRSVKRKKRKRTFHWHVANPINNYCVALNIAPYEVLKDTYESVTGEKVPVEFYVLPRNVKKAKKALPEFLDHVRFFEETCGPYPFRNEKYGIAETPHLGMEHQTIIAYGYNYRRAAFNYDWLHHHELAHEWWANLVTCRDWKDMWIHEGIGTYMQALYVERIRGEKAYFIQVAEHRRSCNNRRAVAPRESQDSKQIYFGVDGSHDNDIYYKGSCIVHTLRWLLGDDAFFRVLRRWAYPDPAMESVTDGSQTRFADTEEMLAIAERVSERELDWFFDLYLRQPKLPVLTTERTPDGLQLRWETPEDLPFPMPVPVLVGTETVRVPMPEGRGVLELKPEQTYEVDPNDWVLKR